MFDTNDVYNDAVRGSSIHAEEDNNSGTVLVRSKIVATLLLTSIAYVGFNFYNTTNSINSMDENLVVKKELVSEIQIKSESFVTAKITNSEEDYLNALRAIESELTEERKSVTLDTTKQMSLSSAMNDIMNDTVLAENTGYTDELRKEIGIVLDDTEDSRTVIVKKGDTLQGISNKFYGDAMNYKRIIASNANLNSNDTIYVGQTILLPY